MSIRQLTLGVFSFTIVIAFVTIAVIVLILGLHPHESPTLTHQAPPIVTHIEMAGG